MTIAEKLKAIAANEQNVYNAGYKKGKAEGGGDGYYDTFWDDYQDKGKRTNYIQAFCRYGWTDGNFNPKYELKNIEYASAMFDQTRIASINVPIDFTALKAFNSPFSNARNVVTIHSLKVLESTQYPSWFLQCIGLKDITFDEDSVIGENIVFQDSTKLSKASIENIIGHLSTTASGRTLTLSKTAVNTAFNMTDDNPSEEWTTIVGTRQNWTISLV